MVLLDGKKLAEEVKLEIKKEVDAMVDKGQRPPHLAAILVGDNPASKAYVSTKIKFCEDVGYGSTLIALPGDTSEGALLEEVQKLNANGEIDGYIVQLPLPRHIDEQKINEYIAAGYKIMYLPEQNKYNDLMYKMQVTDKLAVPF